MANKHRILLFSVLVVIFPITRSQSSSNLMPVIRVLQSVDLNIQESNNKNTNEQMSNYKVLNVSQNSDLLVENKVDSATQTKLIFECRAPYLVQWLYTGLGTPEFSTNLTMTPGHRESIATMYLGFQRNLAEQDTGNYTCRSIRDSNMSTYIYLFSSGGTLFTTKGNENITYRDSDEYVRIPCGLSQPKASVSLQKSINGQLQCPMNDSISFDPKTGYTLKLKEFSDPQGFYICSAGYNHRFQMIEYSLVHDLPGSNDNETTEAISSSTTPKSTTTVRSISSDQKCQINAECSPDTACIEENCVDPCKILCAKNSNCYIANHVPHCSCNNGYTGDPYSVECDRIEDSTTSTTASPVINTGTKSPCEPNPCGGKSTCKYDGLRVLCTCQSGYIGSPPYCRPECEKDSDCPYSRACTVEKRCENPCRAGVCGRGAQCRTVNHYPVCNCPRGTSGDAYVECHSSEENHSMKPSQIATSPCDASVSPCGPNTDCIVINNQAACRCAPGFRGSPYSGCRADGCSYNTHCSSKMACFAENGTCVDPCILQNPCGERRCVVNKHTPVCLSYPKPSTDKQGNSSEIEPCLSSPCGPNTVCKAYKGGASCSCMPLYDGNPWIGCTKIKCKNDDSCKFGEKCVEGRCMKNRMKNDIIPDEMDDEEEALGADAPEVAEDPILGQDTIPSVAKDPVLGEGPVPSAAEDPVVGEAPVPIVPEDPVRIEGPLPLVAQDPISTESSAHVIGEDPVVTESPLPFVTEDPTAIEGSAPLVAEEPIIAENPVRVEDADHLVDQDSIPVDDLPVAKNDMDACKTFSCGNRAACRVFDEMAICECIEPFKGNPYEGCILPCRNNSDCPDELSCSTNDSYCKDPCLSKTPCGKNAQCNTISHKVTCSCPESYEGNPVVECSPISSLLRNENITNENDSTSDPCLGVVCGDNQRCSLKEGVVICECEDNFKMKLGKGCVAENVGEPDKNASSIASFSIPAFVQCHPLPCGSFAFCNEETDPRSCKCLPEYYGDPYSSCYKGIECESNDDCSTETSCMNKRCLDPCKSSMGCGVNQVCKTENHNPNCRCKRGYQDDATGHCQNIAIV